MTQAQIQRMFDTKTVVLTKAQTFWYYSIIPFFLIVPALTTIDVFKYFVTQTYDSTKPIDYIFGYFWISPSLAFYFIQKSRLRFRTINRTVDNNAFHQSVERTAKELEWHIIQMTNNIVVAKSGFSWRSWGEQITILHTRDCILFNSICDPDNRPSVASFGMNKINRKTFEKFLS